MVTLSDWIKDPSAKNSLFSLLQNLWELTLVLASLEQFPCNSFSVNASSIDSTYFHNISAILFCSSNPTFVHDIACCMTYGVEHPQWLGSLFNGSSYLKRTVSQNSAFDKLNSSRLIYNTVNQLEELDFVKYNLILFSCKTFFKVMSWGYFIVSSFTSMLLMIYIFSVIFSYCVSDFLFIAFFKSLVTLPSILHGRAFHFCNFSDLQVIE